MDLETSLFKKYKIDYDKLMEYGFIKDDGKYTYEAMICDNMMKVIVSIIDDDISGVIIDLNTNLEYTNYRLNNIMGSFAMNVKDEYLELLKDIRSKCFNKEYFINPQSNRLTSLICDKYQVLPEFLWDDYPDFGIFRNKRSNKWFGLIMNVDKSKIDKKGKGNVDLLNIKIDDVNKYLDIKGIFPAYHMNKRSWISIILDDTLDDGYILELIDKSYNLNSILGAWLVPANPNYFDIVNAFNDTDTIIWKQSNNILKDDIVFLYVGSPYSYVMYKCMVIEANIPYEYHDDNLRIEQVMKIKLLKKYNKDEFNIDILRTYGIKSIRGPRGITQELFDALNR